MADNIRLQLKNSNAPDDWKDAGDNSDSPALPVRVVGSAVASAIGEGSKSVATPGTAVPLVSSSTPCTKVIVTANMGSGDGVVVGNTGYVVVGGAGVVAAAATRKGTPLMNNSISIDIDDLNKIYLDAEVAEDGVTFTYF